MEAVEHKRRYYVNLGSLGESYVVIEEAPARGIRAQRVLCARENNLFCLHYPDEGEGSYWHMYRGKELSLEEVAILKLSGKICNE